MGPFALTIQVGASHSILTSTETILSLSSKNSQSSQKGLLRSFTDAARNLTLMERIQRGITIENGKARAWLQCSMREFDGHGASRRSRRSRALTSARTRTRFVDLCFRRFAKPNHVARAFSLLFCYDYEGEAFFPKLLSRELTRSRPTAYVDWRAASLASVSLWTSYAEDACSGAHHVACDDFSGCFICFLVVVFLVLIFKRVRRALVFVRVCVQREVGGDDDASSRKVLLLDDATQRILGFFWVRAVSLVLN